MFLRTPALSIPYLLVVGLAGCYSAGAGLFPPAAGSAPPPAGAAAPYVQGATLGPGDIFTVKVFREPDLSGDYMVASNGTIDFPMVGKVEVAGLTPSEASDRIAALLAQCCLREPNVSILIKEYNSKKVYVFGQVQKPGTFAYEDRMTIVEAITLAGGFTKTAWRARTNITRVENGVEKKLTIPIDEILDGKSQNVTLQPGDIVYVPESIF